MAGELTNNETFTPSQYNDEWSRNDLVRQYVYLYAEYLTLRGQIDHARTALPFQRERVIHNLQNRRLMLENENRQLRFRNEWQTEARFANDMLRMEEYLRRIRAQKEATDLEIERLKECYDESEYTNHLLVEDNKALEEKLHKKNKGKVDSKGSSEACTERCKRLEEDVKLLKEIIAIFKDRLTKEEREAVEAIAGR
ncbi:hypothetical protein DDE82_006495 [Stemphylium lycopersici]|uniref:Uncharacterized protein n=1 Tax=Stemphylium lycopersici TaxID=183478 RepID=A0A364MVK3_STELY|nr:hypothetical protein TW65_01155 [Stemphylium lycopersici]RAR01506.1 hypothetical protein DDE82_006495 [Stemphylium lycopersici]RAR04925.1 hypothetical protein DDE83_007625 [Stemphylium lycopersici]